MNEIINFVQELNTDKVISTLSAIGALGSALATYFAFKVAKSSKLVAENALSFQYKESIKESIELIFSTLVTLKENVIKNDIADSKVVTYTLSMKNTDWIFAAQEVENIISCIDHLATDDRHKKQLMERYGRILGIKICSSNYAKNNGIFTASSVGNTHLDVMFTRCGKNMRDRYLFTVYLFTERYEAYKEGSGQYPSPNICCYFNENTNFDLS